MECSIGARRRFFVQLCNQICVVLYDVFLRISLESTCCINMIESCTLIVVSALNNKKT